MSLQLCWLAGWSMQQQQQHHHIIDQHRLFAFIPLSFHSLHSILSTDAVTAPDACLPLTTTISLSSLPLRHRLGLHLPAQHPLVLDTSRYIYFGHAQRNPISIRRQRRGRLRWTRSNAVCHARGSSSSFLNCCCSYHGTAASLQKSADTYLCRDVVAAEPKYRKWIIN